MKQPLIIPVLIDGSELYQNLEDYPFFHNGRKFIVEKGFVCDGASVPRLLWPIMPPDGLQRGAALAHDRIYGGGYVVDGYMFTLWEADMLFRRLMIEAGMATSRANMIWFGLKLGSWYSWAKCKGSKPEILPISNQAPQRTARKPRLFRHIYETA